MVFRLAETSKEASPLFTERDHLPVIAASGLFQKEILFLRTKPCLVVLGLNLGRQVAGLLLAGLSIAGLLLAGATLTFPGRWLLGSD